MLILPTDPLFLDTMIQFVRSFTPTLSIHRVHVAERREDLLSLQIEMTNGTIMFVEAGHQVDRIQVVLEYGWQRVDIWMYANFPYQDGSTGFETPLDPFSCQHRPYDIHPAQLESTRLQVNCANKISMDRVFSQNVDEESFELGGEAGFEDSSFGDLLGHGDLSRMKIETVSSSIAADMVEESRFVFKGNGLKNGTLKKSELPKSHSGFEHSVFWPRTADGEFEQSL